MPTITDIYHKINIKLNTDLQITPPSQNIYLDVYKKNNVNEDVLVATFVPTTTASGFSFDVPFNDSRFSVGDNLSKFVVKLNGTFNLYDLHEGISIVVDGVETSVREVLSGTVQYDELDEPVMIDVVRNPEFALAFQDNNLHTVQAVFKGNKELGVAISNKLTLQAQQRDDNSALVGGKYILKAINIPQTLKYMEQPNFMWRLTKGGTGVADVGLSDIPVTNVPVGGKTVEIAIPSSKYSEYNSIHSKTTDSNGYIRLGELAPSALRRWTVGKWKIGAKFYHYDEVEEGGVILTESWRTLTIEKNDPKFSFVPAGAKGKNAKFKLKDPQNEPLANKKLIIKVNGKKYIKTTTDYGNVYITINGTGHFKYKVTYGGDSNLNQVTKIFEETIS